MREQEAFRIHPARTIGRLALWRFMTWARMPGSVRLDSSQTRLRVPSEWHGIAKLVFVFKDLAEAELPVVGPLDPEGTLAVDVGAHYGDYTVTLCDAVGPQGEVWAIEPCSAF